MKTAKFFIIFTLLLAFVPQVSAQVNAQYPNELEGYHFFGTGKLENLRLTVSSKDDVQKVFGNICKTPCNYDSDWSVRFEYYEDLWSTQNEKGKYILDSKYLGAIRSIEIRPKNQISFAKFSFPDTFQKLEKITTIDTRSRKSRSVIYDSYQDLYGLGYEVYNQTGFDDIKDSKTKSYNKGDLVLISYTVTKKHQDSLFVLQK